MCGQVGAIVLKENLKEVNKDLRSWHKEQSSNLSEKIQISKKGLNRLDEKKEI